MNKMNKKNRTGFVVSMMAAVAIVLSGCGSAASTAAASSTAASSTQASESTAASAAESTTAAAGDNKVLVVYYSATGDTKRDAEEIAKVANADIFEVTPVDPYTNDDLNWSDSDSRVSKEHEDESLRDVPLTTTDVPNWDSYSTVFIGYPIWWGVAAWPINGFVKANDFTGKTVYPFASSLSSGIGSSATDLEKLTNTGDWQEGQRFSSSASESDVDKWAQSLGLAD